MKRIYILIIIICGFFMFNSSVFAWSEIIPDYNPTMRFWKDSTTSGGYITKNTTLENHYGTEWYCYNGSTPANEYSHLSIKYTNLPFDGTKNYDIYFLIKVPMQGVLPLIVQGYPSCEITAPESFGVGGGTAQGGQVADYITDNILGVKCADFQMTESPTIGAYFNKSFIINQTTNTLNFQGMCISRKIRYTLSETQVLSDLQQSNATGYEEITNEQKKTTEEVKKNTEATKEVNNTLKDSSVDNQQAEGFFNDFNDNSHGLSGIITAPLNMINNLASATCSSININIPFVDTEFSLPCMSTIYQQNFGNLFSIYRTITFGIVAYYVCVNIFALVKGFKDPENDKVEVVEL